MFHCTIPLTHYVLNTELAKMLHKLSVNPFDCRSTVLTSCSASHKPEGGSQQPQGTDEEIQQRHKQQELSDQHQGPLLATPLWKPKQTHETRR